MSIGPSGPWPHPQGGPVPVSTSWRIQHSLWLLAPVLGCCLGGLGLVYVGLRAGRTAWWGAGALYTVVGSILFFVFSVVDPESNLAVALTLVLIVIWAVTIVHSCVVNVAWLRWRATREAPAAGAAWRPPAPAQPGGHHPPLRTVAPPGYPAPGYPSPAVQGHVAPGYPAPAAPGYPAPATPGYPTSGAPGYPVPAAAPGYPNPAFDPYAAGRQQQQEEEIGPASDPWSEARPSASPPAADPTAAPPSGSSGMTPPPFPPAGSAS